MALVQTDHICDSKPTGVGEDFMWDNAVIKRIFKMLPLMMIYSLAGSRTSDALERFQAVCCVGLAGGDEQGSKIFWRSSFCGNT